MHLMWNESKNQSVLAGVCPCVNLDSQQNHIKTQNFVKHLKVHKNSVLICMPKASAAVSQEPSTGSPAENSKALESSRANRRPAMTLNLAQGL